MMNRAQRSFNRFGRRRVEFLDDIHLRGIRRPHYAGWIKSVRLVLRPVAHDENRFRHN